MNILCRPLVPLLLMCFFSCQPGANSADGQSKTEDDIAYVYEPLDKILNQKWKDVTVQVHLSGVRTFLFGRSEQVHAKQNVYYSPRVMVTVFVTPQGEVWVGPKQDFYIETPAGVVGGSFTDQDILWCDSLITKRPGETIGLDSALKRLKEEVDASKLEDADSRYPHDSKHILKRVTELRDCFAGKNVFGVNSTGSEECCAVHVRLGTLRLDFKSIADPGATGSAWIDIKTKKLLKVVTHQPDYPWKDIRMTKDSIEVVPLEPSFPQPGDYWLGSAATACIVALLLLRAVRRRKQMNISQKVLVTSETERTDER